MHVTPPYPLSIPRSPGAPAASYDGGFIAARDGARLFLNEWMPGGSREAATHVIVLVHGIGMHGAPYGAISQGFAERGIALLVPDLRSHGRSDGPPGCLACAATLTGDLDAIFYCAARRYPRRPLFVCGESMGGLIAAEYARRRADRLAGAILVAPAFRLHLRRFFGPLPIARFLVAGKIVIDTPALLEVATRVPEFNAAKRADPYATRAVRPHYLLRLGLWGLRWPRAGRALEIPLQIHYGRRDRIIDHRATRRVHASRDAGQRPSELHEWEDACHTLFWDEAAPRLVASICDWTLTHAPPM